MNRDFEDIHDLDNLSDTELRDLARQHLAANNSIDVDDLVVTAFEGSIHLAGRVGTEQELRIAERVLTDGLGIENVVNELVVDPLRRAESPEAIDEHLADEDAHSGLLLGDRALPISPEAEHLVERDTQRAGTHDVGDAIENGGGWIPPESPTPEGLGGTDSGSGSLEAH